MYSYLSTYFCTCRSYSTTVELKHPNLNKCWILNVDNLGLQSLSGEIITDDPWYLVTILQMQSVQVTLLKIQPGFKANLLSLVEDYQTEVTNFVDDYTDK